MAGQIDKNDKSSRPNRTEGVFMISVAAKLAGMHPQTLRIYETRGLIKPQRSPKLTRLYSQQDVERLKQIQDLTHELGMNLAGVERVFQLEDLMSEMRHELKRTRQMLDEMEHRLKQEIEAVHKSYKRELVLYDPKKTEIVRAKDFSAEGFQIPIDHVK